MENNFAHKPVLCNGTLDIAGISIDCGLKYFITIEEYAVYKETPYLEFRKERKHRNEVFDTLSKR